LVEEGFIAALVAQSDQVETQRILEKAVQEFSGEDFDALAQALKSKAFEYLWGDAQNSLRIADILLLLANLSKEDYHRALGLRVKAQALSIGLGQYLDSLEYYDQASAIYSRLNDTVRQARVSVTKVSALAHLGRHQAALAEGQAAARVLEGHAQWQSLATLHNNLALVYKRTGKYAQALDMFDQARQAYVQLGEQGEPFLPNTDLNRALAKRNLGQFDEAIEANQAAIFLAEKLGQSSVLARAFHAMGNIYYFQGQNTRALALYDRALEIHLTHGPPQEAAQCELSILDCLLELRRFSKVLEKCDQIVNEFLAYGMRLEAAVTMRNQAAAYLGLERYDEAVKVLTAAQKLFDTDGNNFESALTELEISALLYHQGSFELCRRSAASSIKLFENLNLPGEICQGNIMIAKAALASNDFDTAQNYIQKALVFAEKKNLPFQSYQCFRLSGRLAYQLHDYEAALSAFQRASMELERLRGQVMTEYQAGFLEDKQSIYEDMVALCIETGKHELGLEYAERAKSRALLELLEYRVDLGIKPRRDSDQPLVAEIQHLRTEREILLSFGRQEHENKAPFDSLELQQKILGLEEKITDCWHKLLVRNSEYSQDISLWQVRTEEIAPYLSADTVLLEFFSINGDLVVFLVQSVGESDMGSVSAHHLGIRMEQVEQLLQRFALNLRSVPRSKPDHIKRLTANVQGILAQLYQHLIAPLDGALGFAKNIIVVPHGSLHYLPFHALFDGNKYLIEKFQMSYLPAASLLRYTHQNNPKGSGVLAVGHSFEGRLPYAVAEARSVAHIMAGDTLLEAQANRESLAFLAASSRLIHIAGHGDFRPDNPLFSGLALADGWLTTLDIFNMHLQASLVTLSACQTGRSVVGGGDELLGLTRAFLSAGAASLLLSLWAVADRSTSQLMEYFYHALAAGDGKGTALQAAQRQLIIQQAGGGAVDYSHPYYWAPFFLVGAQGPV